MGAVDRVRELVTPIVEQAGAELYDVELESGIARIAIDKDGGIDVDAIGDISSLISDAFDQDDPIPDQRYLLEVTSPGIERKLRTPQHFIKQLGEEVNVKTKVSIDGVRRFTGRLIVADDSGIEIAVDPVDQSHRLNYDDIESARTVFHWGEQTKPPGRASAKSNTNKKAATG